MKAVRLIFAIVPVPFVLVAGYRFIGFEPQCQRDIQQKAAMSRKPLPNQAIANFAGLLNRHLGQGTRPGRVIGEPWKNAEFAEAITGRTRVNRRRAESAGVADTTVSAWRLGKSLPSEIEPILRALFGPLKTDGGNDRRELREAFNIARAWRTKSSLEAAQNPLGLTYVPRERHLVINYSPAENDIKAAAAPEISAEHQVVLEATRGLVLLIQRRGNQLSSPGWDDLLPTAGHFLASINCSPEELPQRLATAYYACVSLGSLLDQDDAYRVRAEDGEAPLSADLRRKLGDVVTFSAHLLHAFPYVVERDRRLRRFLANQDVDSARVIALDAREREVLLASDQEVVDDIITASMRTGAQGDKAKEHLVAAISNLLLVGAAAVLNVQTPDGKVLAERMNGLFASAAQDVGVLVRMLSPDVRAALQHAILRNSGIAENSPASEDGFEKSESEFAQVLCFTPKGETIVLPRGSTSVDFAYAVHSQIGDTCVGARINGRLMQLRRELEDGDQVEILTAKGGTPSPAWERFVVTEKARAHIRRYLTEDIRDRHRDQGKSEVEKAFRHNGVAGLEGDWTPIDKELIAKEFNQATLDDLYVAVATGKIDAMWIVHKAYPELINARAPRMMPEE